MLVVRGKQNDDYAYGKWGGFTARGPAFQRVSPAGRPAAGKIACPTWLSGRTTLDCGGIGVVKGTPSDRKPGLGQVVAALVVFGVIVGVGRRWSTRRGEGFVGAGEFHAVGENAGL